MRAAQSLCNGFCFTETQLCQDRPLHHYGSIISRFAFVDFPAGDFSVIRIDDQVVEFGNLILRSYCMALSTT
jgi:hypothetical protein